jgi:phosphoenolpyruvate phosphomutase
MSKRAGQLRELLERPGVIRLIGAHNALGAKLGERAGFEGIWSSSLEISASYAVPDAGILTMSEFLDAAQSMARAVGIPVVADVDTGYGNSINVIHMVQKFEAAGMAAVCMEDKLFPKVNSFVPGRQELVSVAEFVGKLMAAKSAQDSPDFMVIARVEALIAGLGLEEALRRARAYAAAGADAILIHDKNSSADSIVEFVHAWDLDVPLVVIPTTYYRITIREIEQLGVKMVIYANQGLRSSIHAMEETFAEIVRAGTSAPVESKIAPMSLVFELQGFPQLKQDEKNFLRAGTKRVRAIIPAAGDHLNEYSMKDLAADIPIAMLDINGKSLLRHQVEALKALGVHDIIVVGGYKRDKIQLDGITLAANDDWQTTRDMASILCGADGRDDDTLVAYSDILFSQESVAKLIESDADITLLVDNSYPLKTYPQSRLHDLVAVAEPHAFTPRALSTSARNRVLKLGQMLPPADAHCEFTGLAFFSREGFRLLREVYGEVAVSHRDRPFHEAASARTASLTDVLQELIDRGYDVECIEVSSGWMEIHSFADYQLAHRLVG